MFGTGVKNLLCKSVPLSEKINKHEKLMFEMAKSVIFLSVYCFQGNILRGVL